MPNGAIIEAIGLTAEAAMAVAELVRDSLDAKREAFTQNFVSTAREQHPDYNVVIIHPNHRREGCAIHQHVELNLLAGTSPSIGYEVYMSKVGWPFWLENLGDGGYINWAYDGYFNRDGNRITSNTSVSLPPGSYATVYDDHNFSGYSQNLTPGRYDWGQIHNDTISSLRVPEGMRVTLYWDTHFQGASKTFTQDDRYVGNDFNDQTSSIIVECLNYISA